MNAGVDVHYVIDAAPTLPVDAPTLVLSNSLGTTHRMWDKQIDLWSRHFKVVRFDTRGHGASPVPAGPYTIDHLADDVIALLDRLNLDRVHFVGLSLGGMIGMRLAARNPERVDSLTVMCTSPYMPPAESWTDRARVVRAQGAQAIADVVVRRWYTSALYESDPARMAEAREVISSTPREGYASCAEAIATMDLRSDLPNIVAPTLAIAGADDPATPPPDLQLIADSVKDGRLLVVRHAAHLANDEQPTAIGRAVLAHLGVEDA